MASTGVGTTDLTASIKHADGTETPIDLRPKQLPLFEGKRYPDVTIALAGGVKGDADFLLPEVTSLKIGESFEVVVRGEVTAKKHALKRDEDGQEQRTLVITLKVDDVTMPPL